MLLIIDGYNLLKYIIKKGFASEQDRIWFIDMLENYANEKSHQIIIVFDGGSFYRPTYTKRGQVAILYSGVSENADAVIKKLIVENKNKNILLVTTDRALHHYALKEGVVSLDSKTFYMRLAEKKEPPLKLVKGQGSAIKLHKHDINPDLDTLMEEGSTVMLKKEEIQQSHKNNNRLSKKERRLLQITKKL